MPTLTTVIAIFSVAITLVVGAVSIIIMYTQYIIQRQQYSNWIFREKIELEEVNIKSVFLDLLINLKKQTFKIFSYLGKYALYVTAGAFTFLMAAGIGLGIGAIQDYYIIQEVAEIEDEIVALSGEIQQPIIKNGVLVDEALPIQIASSEQSFTSKPITNNSEWKIQVSSQRNLVAAERSYLNMRQRFPDLLNARTALVQRADVAGKGTFYRVKILGYSKEEAASFCSSLKNAGGSCFVTR